MTSAINSLLEDAVSSGLYLGLSFIVVDKDGNRIYSGTHGRRSFNSDEPMSLSTGGWLASMTKLMTSTAAMLAVQQGLVGLDDDVATILPELREKEIWVSFDEETKVPTTEPIQGKITLRQLLSHSSGCVYPFLSPVLQKWATENNWSSEHISGDFKVDWDYPLGYQPGTSWRYGQGVDWAGKVVEKISGKSLEEYMQEYMWGPLGMKNTTFHPEKRELLPLLDMGIRTECGDKRIIPAGSHIYPIPTVNEAGGAGIFSNADDYAKLLEALLSNDGTLLKAEIIEEFVRPQLNEAGKAGLLEEREKWVLPEIPKDIPVDHALGGLVTAADVPGGRPKGAMTWDGYSNSNWLLDRTNGVALVLVTQVVPGDPSTKALWKQLESEVYEVLRN
ncbi:hypothetical protein G7Y89_g8411 [Cudoniella acicularis]|uniref:Beta-lactamase-related domain-containing protein n=1 Tax=Cudoniella acicularis TaxID=354080 RepID=A0A8H4RI75_9HELO|nr:hypothetical protein G7Y89_g8411 [Cudoniella acicularis]